MSDECWTPPLRADRTVVSKSLRGSKLYHKIVSERDALLKTDWQRNFDNINHLQYARIYPRLSSKGEKIVVLEPYSLKDVHDSQSLRSALDGVLMYTLALLQSVADSPVIIVFVHDKLPDLSSRYLAWLFKIYRVLPKLNRRNIKNIYILALARRRTQLMVVAKRFISKRFYKKVHFVQSIPQLEEAVGLTDFASGPFKSMLVFGHESQSIHDEQHLLAHFADPDASNQESESLFNNILNKVGGQLEHEGDSYYSFASSATSAKSSPYNSVKLISCKEPGRINFEVTLNDHLPRIVYDCLRYLTLREAHRVAGIFRIPGDADKISKILNGYSENETPIDLETVEDVHTIASVLKSYFRKLMPPIVNAETYHRIIEIISHNDHNDEQTVSYHLGDTLLCLPSADFRTLGYLMHYLSQVMQHSDENLMDARNIAVVWAPSILRPPEATNALAHLMELPKCVFACKCMLTCVENVFPPELIFSKALMSSDDSNAVVVN